MNRGVVVLAGVVAVAGACAASDATRGPARAPGAIHASADASAPTRVGSVALAGAPGALAVDGAGIVVTVGERAVVALDEQGRERWSAPVAGASLGRPVLDDGLVVVPTAPVGEPEGRDRGGCVALERSTGARRWAFERSGAHGVAAAGAGASVLCAMSNGVMVVLDRDSGAIRGREIHASADASISDRTALAVDEEAGIGAATAAVGVGWQLVMVDLRRGVEVRAINLGTAAPPSAPVMYSPGRLAVAVGDPPVVLLVDVRSQQVAGSIPVRAPDGFDPAAVPLLTGDLLVVVARGGEVSAVDLDRRRVRWSARLPVPALDNRPVCFAGVVVLADWTRRVRAFRRADGRAVRFPPSAGSAIDLAADPVGRGRCSPGVEIARRGPAGGRIEHWTAGGAGARAGPATASGPGSAP